MKNTREILKKIGLSKSEVDLYLAMLAQGALLPTELIRLTGGKRPTVYYALRQLEGRGLVHKVPSHGLQRFQADPPEQLLSMLKLRQEELKTTMDEVTECLPELKKNEPRHEGVPVVSFYQGEQAMKQVVMETLYCRSGHIDILTPKDNFFWQVGQTYSQKYIDERVARKITTRNLWEEPLRPDILTRSYKGLSEVRLLPSPMHGTFRSTLFLYDDKVMYISSLKSGYILLVQSQEHQQLMQAMFSGLWESSSALAAKPFKPA